MLSPLCHRCSSGLSSKPAKKGSLFSNLKQKFSSQSGGKSASRERIYAADVKYTDSAKTSLNPFTNYSQEDAPPPYTSATDLSVSGGNNFSKCKASATVCPAFKEDPYAYLSDFDTIFVIDDSTSMTGNRWKEARNVLASIAPVCASRDPDGIDIYFLNHKPTAGSSFSNNERGYVNISSADQIKELFEQVQPSGLTPTGACLNRILRPYLKNLKKMTDLGKEEQVKPINIIVITDGAPQDAPEEVIEHCARTLNKLDAPAHQVGIQFFQVGDDQFAKSRLEALDDGLCKMPGVRDIVDTVTWQSNKKTLTAEGILKVVLGAVTRRLDNMTIEEMMRLRRV